MAVDNQAFGLQQLWFFPLAVAALGLLSPTLTRRQLASTSAWSPCPSLVHAGQGNTQVKTLPSHG